MAQFWNRVRGTSPQPVVPGKLSENAFYRYLSDQIIGALPKLDFTVSRETLSQNDGSFLPTLIIQSRVYDQAYFTMPDEQYYEQYRDGSFNLGSVLDKICGAWEEMYGNPTNDEEWISGPHHGTMEQMMDLDNARSRIFPRVIPTRANETFLANSSVPYTNFGDFAVTYYVELGKQYICPVNFMLRKQWELETKDLHEIAIANMLERYPSALLSISETIAGERIESQKGKTPEQIILGAKNGDRAYRMTSQGSSYGATALLDKRFLDGLAQKFAPHGFYLLPATIREVMIVPKDSGYSMQEMSQIMHLLNHTETAPWERLGERIYEYDSEAHELVPVKPMTVQPEKATARLFIDMDGTLARFHDDVKCLERMWEPGFFNDLKPFAEVVQGVKTFMKDNPSVEVFILSSCIDSPTVEGEKNAWLDRYLPEIDKEHRIFPGMNLRKTDMVPGGIKNQDYLLDDYNVNLQSWQEAGGQAIKCHNNVNHRGLNGPLWPGKVIHAMQQDEDIAEELRIFVASNTSLENSAELPNGWYWQHFQDGSGSLHDPYGNTSISYDKGFLGIEYSIAGQGWNLFEGSMQTFQTQIEELIVRALSQHMAQCQGEELGDMD